MPDSAAKSMVPLWIGSGKDALFALLHVPEQQRSVRSAAVVIVPPFGYEAICAHRALRSLAERLAQRGFFALRYDHPGTGDSAGDSAEAPISAFLNGVSRAVEAAKHACGGSRIILVGLRAGALMALKAAEGREDVASLVAWAPPLTGRAYVRELRALGSFAAERAREPQNREQIAGFAYSREMLAELSGIDARTIAAPRGAAVLLVPRDDVPEPPHEQLGAWANDAEIESWPGLSDTMRDPHEVRLPELTLDRIADWIAERNPRRRRRRAEIRPRPRVELESQHKGCSIVEEAVSFGPGHRLFGIVTLPEPATEKPACVLWLNAGATHRVGMNNNYVSIARSWAERGVASLRFDSSGLGDSPARNPDRENALYSPEMVADARSAMDFMEHTYGTRRFVLAGLCAGGYAAFHAALADERVTSALIINPQTFDWRPGDSLAIERRRSYRAANWYRRSALRLDSWRKALRGEVDLLLVGKLLAGRFFTHVHSRIAALRTPQDSRTLTKAFEALCNRGTNVLLVYSAEDPGLDHLRDELGNALGRLQRHRCFALEIIDGTDHTFSPLESQAKLTDCLTEYLSRWHALSEPTPSAKPAADRNDKPAEASPSALRSAKRALASLLPQSLLIVHGPRGKRRIALTFDDGPTELTRAYLEVLERYRVPATFFLVGQACERWPAEASEIARRGHVLGGHGYTHRTFPMLESRALLDELKRTNDLLPAQNARTRWLRPPYGAVTPRSLFDCARAGFSTVLWSYDSGDSRTTSAEALLGGLVAHPPRSGDIVLLHEDQPHTLQVLPHLLEQLLESEYELVTVPELLR